MKKIISKLIEEQNHLYLKSGIYFILPEEGKINPNPSHINNGFCYKYAYDLEKKLKAKNINCEVIGIEYLDVPHAFIKIENSYYDSETPNGVTHYLELPLFKSLQSETTELIKKDNVIQKIMKKLKF